jgi:hypothetical protein
VSEHETLTAERALHLLREVVAERPDYVYRPPDDRGCCYIDRVTDEPSCLIGHVLVRAGWTPSELRRANRSSVDDLPPALRRDISEEAACLLAEAQAVQDTKGTWAQALAEAERFATGGAP